MKRLAIASIFVLGLVWAPETRAEGEVTLRGTVTPVEWAQEVEVCSAAAVEPQRCAAPHADGTYQLRQFITPGFVEFIPTYRSGLLIQYYNHASSLSEAQRVGNCEGCVSAIEPINADLVEGGAITGTVAGEGLALSEVEVCAISQALPTAKSCTETDASGDYELHSLPSGSYKVGFWGGGPSAEYQPSYYQGKGSLAQATPVGVSAGTTTAGIDATLAKGAQIGGTVTAQADGSVLEGVSVCLFSVSGSTAQRCTESDAGGRYSFQGLPDGSYQVGFALGSAEIGSGGSTTEGSGFQPQYYDGVATRAAAASIPVIAPGITDGVDAALLVLATPASPPLASPVANPAVAAPPIVTAPRPRKADCKKGFRKKKIKGKARCAKKAKKKTKKKARRHHRRNARHHKPKPGGKKR